MAKRYITRTVCKVNARIKYYDMDSEQVVDVTKDIYFSSEKDVKEIEFVNGCKVLKCEFLSTEDVILRVPFEEFVRAALNHN